MRRDYVLLERSAEIAKVDILKEKKEDEENGECDTGENVTKFKAC